MPAFHHTDPSKQAIANRTNLAEGLVSRSELILESGRGPSQVFEQIVKDEVMERELRERYGLTQEPEPEPEPDQPELPEGEEATDADRSGT